MKIEIKKILYKFLQDGISSDEAAQQVLDLFAVGSRFDKKEFDHEWQKRSRMNFPWEWVEDYGCINKTQCRRLVKKLLRQ